VLGAMSPRVMDAIEILREEESEKREKQACHFQPQNAAGMSERAPNGLAEAPCSTTDGAGFARARPCRGRNLFSGILYIPVDGRGPLGPGLLREGGRLVDSRFRRLRRSPVLAICLDDLSCAVTQEIGGDPYANTENAAKFPGLHIEKFSSGAESDCSSSRITSKVREILSSGQERRRQPGVLLEPKTP